MFVKALVKLDSTVATAYNASTVLSYMHSHTLPGKITVSKGTALWKAAEGADSSVGRQTGPAGAVGLPYPVKWSGGIHLDKQEGISQGLELVKRSSIVMVGTNGDDGFPNIKAMLNMEHEGLKKFWFSTNTSSRRVAQLRRDSRACIYFVDAERFMGLMLVGNAEVLQDKASRQRLWRKGFEKYYPLGVDDPDYSVLCFTARWGNFYHRLSNVNFEIP